MTDAYVTATDWAVSYSDSCGREPIRLNVHRFSEPGLQGNLLNHPEHDGKRFATLGLARQYAAEVGLVVPWETHPLNLRLKARSGG